MGKKLKFWLGLISAVVVGAYTAGYKIGQGDTETVTVTEEIISVDTVYVDVEKIIYKNIPAKHDTVEYVHTVHDTTETWMQDVATVDTVLQANSVKYGDLFVAYFPRPIDVFDVSFQPAPLPTVETLKIIKERRAWYDTPVFGFAVGTVWGAAMYYATHNK